MSDAACYALPSSDAAGRLLAGDPGALPAVVGSWAGRAVLVGLGLAVVGERKHLVRNSLAAATAIEVFVLGYTWWRMRQPAA